MKTGTVHVNINGDASRLDAALRRAARDTRKVGITSIGVIGRSETSVYAPAWLHGLGARPRARWLLERLGFVCSHMPISR